MHIEQILVPNNLAQDLFDLRFEYSELILSIMSALKGVTPEQQEKINDFLNILLHETVLQDANCNLLQSFETLMKQSSLFNVHYLKKFNSMLPEDKK